MAKKEKELTVEDKLMTLYNLQLAVSKIDEIRILRGELPLEVQDLEDEVTGLETRLNHINENIGVVTQDISNLKIEIAENEQVIAKLTAQQNEVRNNREYDFLSKEIEFKQLDNQLNEKKMREAREEISLKQEDLEKTKKGMANRVADLEAKRKELDKIIEDTKIEEEKLREAAKVMEAKIEPRLLMSFKRIRKNSHNGLAVVYVQRNACGGCFNKIPPQRQLDIRSRKKIIVCEYCGRIIIDPELAGVRIEEPEEPKKKKRTTRKKAVK
ncbi:MAG: C4-type zinc ribbon domain-containing protein [Bacteroidaceae bacterium]